MDVAPVVQEQRLHLEQTASGGCTVAAPVCTCGGTADGKRGAALTSLTACASLCLLGT